MVQAKFGYRLDDPKWAPDWLSNEQLEMLHSDIDARQVIDGEFEQILKDLKVPVVTLLCLITMYVLAVLPSHTQKHLLCSDSPYAAGIQLMLALTRLMCRC